LTERIWQKARPVQVLKTCGQAGSQRGWKKKPELGNPNPPSNRIVTRRDNVRGPSHRTGEGSEPDMKRKQKKKKPNLKKRGNGQEAIT